jgi:membrane protease YdiL (CAAX protease family)
VDEAPEIDARTLFRIGFFFELGLVAVAAFFGWLFADSPLPFHIRFDLPALVWSVAAVIPWVVGAALLTSRAGRRIGFVRRIYERIRDLLGRAIRGLEFDEIVILAAAAGIGEEVLFRGVLQSVAGGTALGIVVTSLVFGLFHALTPAYFLLATAISIYLGWLQAMTQNLLVPITVHWLYDSVALLLLRRQLRAEAAAASPDGG